MNYNLITLNQVSVANRAQKILNNLTCNITPGKIISVLGVSGSGKTIFLKLLLDLLFPEKGWMIQGNIDRIPGLRTAWVLQNPSLQVFQNFVYEELAKNQVDASLLLKTMQAEHLANQRCLELSQGEKTIVAILRAISHKASLLVLDEILVNLSNNRHSLLLNILRDFTSQGGTVISVEHSPQIMQIADEFIHMANNSANLIDKTAAELLFRQNIKIKSIPAPIQQAAKNNLRLENISDPRIASSLQQAITFHATCGEIIGISGDNGSGKSTLIEIISGIHKSATGAISWNNKILKRLRNRKNLITLTTQDSIQQFFTPKVATELQLANNSSKKQNELISLFNLTKLLNREIVTLSYGEKQRLAIVLSMLSAAPILLFDEPTYGLDTATLTAFLYAISLLSSEQRITIIATHEIALLNLTHKRIDL